MLRLALGDHATVAAELESLTAAHPLRERLWALRALALARAGRQADALEVLRAGPRRARPTSSASTPASSCTTCRPRCCARIRRSPGRRRPPGRSPPPPRRPAAPVAPPRRRGCPTGRWSAATTSWRILVDALDGRRAGRAGFAAVTGDPGIGKSRLCAESWPRAPSPNGARVAGRPVLPGRRRAPAVAVAAGAARPGRRARRTRTRTTRAPSSAPGRRSRAPGRRGGRGRRPSSWCSTTCTGPTRPRLRVLRLLVETVDTGRAADARHLAHRIRSPTGRARRRSRSRWPGVTPSGSTCTGLDRGRGRRGGRGRSPR